MTEGRPADLSDDACPLCTRMGRTGRLIPFETAIRDFEYGIERAAVYARCNQCGLVAQRPAVPADQIPDLYPADYQAFRKPKKSLFAMAKRWLVRRDARAVLAAAGTPEPVILEIGCGNGALLEAIHLQNPKANVHGVDIMDLGLSDHPVITFHAGQLEDVNLPEAGFDAIYFSNLIEHVVDPLAFLDRVRRLLRPGGAAILITPNHRSLDRYVFGKYWGGYHFPRHLYLFDQLTIREAVESAGLECQAIKGSYAWWYISIANCLFRESARRGRGLGFAAISAAMLPIDLAINLIRSHGSMKVVARRRHEG